MLTILFFIDLIISLIVLLFILTIRYSVLSQQPKEQPMTNEDLFVKLVKEQEERIKELEKEVSILKDSKKEESKKQILMEG